MVVREGGEPAAPEGILRYGRLNQERIGLNGAVIFFEAD